MKLTFEEVKGCGAIITNVDDFNNGKIVTVKRYRESTCYNYFSKNADNTWNNYYCCTTDQSSSTKLSGWG